MDQTDIIDLYLKGLLQGEDLDKFLLELKQNKALAEDVDIKKQISRPYKKCVMKNLKTILPNIQMKKQ